MSSGATGAKRAGGVGFAGAVELLPKQQQQSKPAKEDKIKQEDALTPNYSNDHLRDAGDDTHLTKKVASENSVRPDSDRKQKKKKHHSKPKAKTNHKSHRHRNHNRRKGHRRSSNNHRRSRNTSHSSGHRRRSHHRRRRRRCCEDDDTCSCRSRDSFSSSLTSKSSYSNSSSSACSESSVSSSSSSSRSPRRNTRRGSSVSLSSSSSSSAAESYEKKKRRPLEERPRKGQSRSPSKFTKQYSQEIKIRTSDERDVNYYATKIQSQVRGFLTLQRMLSSDDMKRIYQDIVEELVDDYLTGEFIPDLLIDVLTNVSHEYDPVSEEEQAAYGELEGIMTRVVDTEVGKVVRSVVREFMDDYLHFQSRRDHDPVYVNMQRIVDVCVARMADEVVHEALQDMVDSYLFQQQFDVLLDMYLGPIIKEVALDAWTETEIDMVGEDVLHSTLDKLTLEVCEEAFEDAKTTIRLQRQREDFQTISLLMGRMLDRLLMKNLLETVALYGENVLFRAQVHALLRKFIARTLLGHVAKHFEPEERLKHSRATRGALELIISRVLQRDIKKDFVESLDDFEAEIDALENDD